MSAIIWVISGMLAFVLLMAGALKALKGKDGIADKMPWVEDFSDGQVRSIGFAEVMGGIGLIAPAATGIVPILSPIAAACLVPLLLGAVYTHFRRKEMANLVPPLVLSGMAGYLAYVGLLAGT